MNDKSMADCIFPVSTELTECNNNNLRMQPSNTFIVDQGDYKHRRARSKYNPQQMTSLKSTYQLF